LAAQPSQPRKKHNHRTSFPFTTIMPRLFLLLIALFSSSSLVGSQSNGNVFVITTTPCADVSVYPGTTEDDCLAACPTPDLNFSDYSEGPTKQDPQMYRHVSCNCSQPLQDNYFRCVDRTVVWNVQETPVDTCDTFNITSRDKCREFCLDLDAGNYEVNAGVAGVTLCQCGAVTVCEASAGAKRFSCSGGDYAFVATLLASIGIIAMTF
jgi:hypothetical protein